jgi:hypothetical protein
VSQHWDEFSKSLAEPVPRRESLRRLGLVMTATILGPLGAEFAWAGKRKVDPCKAFCKCRNRTQQDQCLKACKSCGQNPGWLGGSCGNYFCCGAGLTPCGSTCADLAGDPDNCGACGSVCEEPGPNEYGTCLFGECAYACLEGAVYCGGVCTFLDSDPDNCGGCGNLCGEAAPYCSRGTCSPCTGGQALCAGVCVEINLDPVNCGGCGVECGPGENCQGGVCTPAESPWNWDATS